MIRGRAMLVCGLGVGLVACGGDGGSQVSDVSASLGCEQGNLDSTVSHVELEHDGRTRSYEIHLPPAYDGETPLPLILNFHGLTSTGLLQEESSGMDTTADREGFIVAYPNGIGNSWNIGGCCGQAAEEEVDDVGFSRAVIEDLGARGCIDTNRVYAAGMSNGGFFTYHLACEAADVIAAAAPVAALLDPGPACAPSRPIPIIQFNGTADPLVPYDGGGFDQAPSAAETMAGWLVRNGCTEDAVVTYQNGNATCETVDHCEDSSSVTLCTMEGAGHCWPGYPCRLQGLGEPTFDIDANEVMWELFSRTVLP